MDVLIVGGGGREHALAWKLSQSPRIKRLFITPGNAGTALVGENLGLNTSEHIIDWLSRNPVELVVVGPDNYLADGLVDEIQSIGIPVFGPTREAARIEWSKSFAKQLMQDEGIPTARSETFTDFEKARDYVAHGRFPAVIKADGLALGKGVIIAQNLGEADEALKSIMREKMLGDAGKEVVIEEFLVGREISIHAFCDGEHVALFPSSQDHKRIGESDTGPNTGGMGTIAPVPWVEEGLLEDIKQKVVIPCVRGLKKRGTPFVGVLYPGIMVTAEGPKVIEFNARFGDPETQTYVRLLKTDLLPILLACVEGNLHTLSIEWERRSACCIVLASGGYPGAYETGKLIHGLERKQAGIEIFHAGTVRGREGVVTNGGRVLGITAIAETLETALSGAYEIAQHVTFEGVQYRKDIGQTALQTSSSPQP